MSDKINRMSLVSYLIPALLKLDAFSYILLSETIGPFAERPVVARSAQISCAIRHHRAAEQ